MRESIGNLTGPDAAWARAMISRLEARGCSAGEVTEAVIFVEDTCARVRQGPYSQFGDPLVFADTLQFPLEPAKASPLHALAQGMGATRVHVLGIILVGTMLVSTLATAFAAGDYADGSPGTTVTAGVPFIFVSFIAFIVVLLRSSVHQAYQHAKAWIFGGTVVLTLVIVIGVLWTQPVLWIGRGSLAAFGVVLGALTFMGFLLAGLRCRRDGEKELAAHLLGTGALTPLLVIGTAALVYFD